MFVPTDVKVSMDLYARARIQPGGFVTAVLENNLLEAVTRADSENLACLREIAIYSINAVPAISRGSRAKVEAWLTGEDIKANVRG